MASYEPLLNGRLSDLLGGAGLSVEAEGRQGGPSKQLDIEVRTRSLIVAIEAEIDSRRGALRDAQERLRQAAAGEVVADRAVAVNYPKGLLRNEFTEATEFEWAVLPSEDFTAGRVDNLAAVIRRLPQDHGDPAVQVSRLDTALELAVEYLSERQIEELAEAMNLRTEQGVIGKQQDRTAAAAKRAMLVVAAASMFHARLDAYLPELRPEVDSRTITAENPSGDPFDGDWPPRKIQVCAEADDVVGALHKAWQLILALDYRPIFEAACKALQAPTHDAALGRSVCVVAKAALEVLRSAASARHDLLGGIFHRLLDTAPFDGSYYTSTDAATLLAALALGPADLPESLSEFRVIDPACGTGTLLMAATERIRDLRGSANEETDAAELIENVLWGLDVNVTACHMAATTLGLLSPSVAFRQMNVYLMPFGVIDRTAERDPRVGSLELLVTPMEQLAELQIKEEVQTQLEIWSPGEQVDTGALAQARPGSFHLVIMNPPFTRDSLRHDQFTKSEEDQLKAREKKLMEGRAGHGSSGSTFFVPLGEHMCSLDDGATLAMVLPLTGAANPAGLEARRLLADWFHVDWVVYSHDPTRPWFSGNTSISEMLVVARRHPAEPENRPPTRFVCLRRNSPAVTDAAAVAAALRDGNLDPSIGEVGEWPAERMVTGQWAPLGLTSAYLGTAYEQVTAGTLFPVQPLGELAYVGPAGQRIRDAFVKNRISDSQGRRALWHNSTDATRTLRAVPDEYIHAKPGEEHKADRYWAQRSRLLLAREPRLNTARVAAVQLDQPVVGSRWVPASVLPSVVEGDSARRWEKALCAWLNSTLGLVTLIGTASPKVLSRPELSLDAMRSLQVPALTDRQAATLAGAFDEHCDTELRPLAEAQTDPTRCALDDAVCLTLGVDTETTGRARTELTREPSVTG